VSLQLLSNGQNSSSYETRRPPLSEQSSCSRSINSGFNLLCSDINPTIFYSITDSDNDNNENRNMIFSIDEYLISRQNHYDVFNFADRLYVDCTKENLLFLFIFCR